MAFKGTPLLLAATAGITQTYFSLFGSSKDKKEDD